MFNLNFNNEPEIILDFNNINEQDNLDIINNRNIINNLNKKINKKGFISMNEIYEELGLNTDIVGFYGSYGFLNGKLGYYYDKIIFDKRIFGLKINITKKCFKEMN